MAEYNLPSNSVILSTADMQGNILTYNKSFLEASGYSEAEIKGKPHSILRHPDMPKEAFKDLWDTIESGRPWFGIVKNKRKNGDHYWVAANASPIYTNDQISGYVSVRYPATAEQKALGERLYAEIRSGQTKMPWTPKPSFDKTLLVSAALGLASAIAVFTLGEWGDIVGSAIGLSALSLALWRGNQLAKPNPTQIKAIHGLANGEFKEPITGHDAWTTALNLLRTRTGQNASDSMDAARESAMLTTALNAASTNIMVADADFTIISINSSLAAMFKRNEASLQVSLPHFSAAAIVGSNMDIFHKNPAHQRAMVSALTQSWTGEIHLGHLVLKLSVVPIIQDAKRIGYVVEWLDRTQEVQLEQNIAQAMDRFMLGFLDSRIDTNHIEGFLKSLSEKINNSMNQLEQAIQTIATNLLQLGEGNLDTIPKTTMAGDIGFMQTALALSMSNQASVVVEIRTQSHATRQAINDISQSIYEASDRSQQQAAALEQSAATSEQIASQAHAMRQHAEQTRVITQNMLSDVNSAQTVMKNTLEAMESILQKSQQMTEIVSLIDSISFQTNLLALNAAVEAARAGEHGRGFAVVAGEVRTLAQKSADAAQNIKQLIDATIDNIRHGNAQVYATEQAILRVSSATHSIQTFMQDMEVTVTQTATGISELNLAIANLDKATQETSALMDSIASEATHVNALGQTVLDTTSSFKTASMNELLAYAERYNDFRIAKARRLIRSWAIRAEANMLYNLSDNCFERNTGITQLLESLDIEKTTSIQTARDQLLAAAQHYCERKQRGEQFGGSDFQLLHTATDEMINALTAEEKQMSAAKSRAALPAPSKSKTDDWGDF